MTKQLIINDRGEIYDPFSLRFKRHIGSDLSFDQTRDLLISQMGYIHISANANCPRVEFSAPAVTAGAVASMLGWIEDNDVKRISHIDPAQQQQSTLVHERRLFNYVCDLGSHLDFRKKPLAVETELRSSLFSKIWEPVQIIAGSDVSDAQRLRAIGGLLGDLFVIAERSASTGRYVIKHNGSKFRKYNKHIGCLREGEPFESLEARGYGQWLADTLAPVKPNRPPKAETIHAMVGVGNSEPILLRYSRVVIPYSYGGVDHVLTGSVVH